MTNPYDAICLCLTSVRMLELGLQRVNQLLTALASPWAGDRLICIGDYARNKDMPRNVLTRDEWEHLDEAKVTLFSHAFSAFRKPRGNNLLTSNRTHTGLSPIEKRQFRALLRRSKSCAWDEDRIRNWVLCNLTKREYVRQETVDAHKKAHGKAAGFAGFLLSRICWSSDPSVSMSYNGDIHRGVWAGDRFEITTIDLLREGEKEWKDVSHEMGKEMAEIWEEY